jgi:phosphate-selective porin
VLFTAVHTVSSDTDVDNVVKQYLLRKGYKKAADALTAERGALSLRQVAATVANDAQVVQQIALHDSAQYTPERYAQSYALFAGWVLSSLDMYKVTRKVDSARLCLCRLPFLIDWRRLID